MQEATASGSLLVEREVMEELKRDGVSGLGNAAAISKVTALMTAKGAWKYLPAIGPSMIARAEVTVRYSDEAIEVWMYVRSEEWAPAYAMFGALAGLLAAWNTVKGCSMACRRRHNGQCVSVNVRGIRDLGLRPDGEWPEENAGGPPEVGSFDVSGEPTYMGSALATGYLSLGGGREVPPDVLESAKAVARAGARGAWEVLPLVHLNNLTAVNVAARGRPGLLEISVETENVSRTGSSMEALFASGAALVNAWVEMGSSREDSVGKLEVLKAIKVPV